MDTKQAKLEIDKWKETLTLREKQEWFRLVNKRINSQRKVSASVVELKNKLHVFSKYPPGRYYIYVIPLEIGFVTSFQQIKILY